MNAKRPDIEAAEIAMAAAAGLRERRDSDSGFRSLLEEDPRAALAEVGAEAPAGLDLRVALNTGDVVHFVMPPDPNAALSDDTLAPVSGGRASSVSSVGSAGTIGCIPSTASTASSAGSLGSMVQI